jgi:hypothetical protein
MIQHITQKKYVHPWHLCGIIKKEVKQMAKISTESLNTTKKLKVIVAQRLWACIFLPTKDTFTTTSASS